MSLFEYLKYQVMKNRLPCTVIGLSIIISSCSVVQKNYKYSLSDGYYRSKIFNEKASKVYIKNNSDSVIVYSIDSKNTSTSSLKQVVSLIPQEKVNFNMNILTFRHLSADVDFLTMIFKFRFKTETFPRQINTNLNGALYMGFRNDIYHLKYPKTPLNTYQRQITHYGFSLGIFSGFGGTPMNPWVTNNNITIEYDGAVWCNGIAGIIGINNASIGIAIGWDHLLDQNDDYWIYEAKPWLGLTIGLRLN